MRHAWMRQLTAGAVLALAATAWAQTTAAPPKSPEPAAAAAPVEPKPGESNAERAKTQPGNNAPFWRAVRESGTTEGYTSLPGAEMGTLIQPFAKYPGSRYTTAGEAWRQVRNQWIIPYGGSLLVIVGLAIALFHWRRGPLGGHLPDTGRVIERFTHFERAAHWSVAVTFVILAVSGLVMSFGKFLLLPIIGGTLFGWLSYVLKTAHNFAGPLFAVALVVLIVGYLKDNLPRAGDLKWLLKGGGLLGDKEMPSHRFNAGEKVVFWVGVMVLGLVVVGSGLVLDKLIPGLLYTRGDMQVMQMIHSVAAVLMMALFCGHIYLGTIGTKGAYDGMVTGYVDEAWAKEHHAHWYDDIKAGKIPAQRSHVAAPGLGAAKPQA